MEKQNSNPEAVGQGGAMRTSAIFLIIVFAGIVVLFFLDKLNKINVPIFGEEAEQQQTSEQKYFAELEEKYKNDLYGGETPEQTLQMFIAALKAGDTELASKYFVIEKQAEWRGKLEQTEEKGSLPKFISKLTAINTKTEGKNFTDNIYQFSHDIKEMGADWIISLTKNTFTNKWKLESL